MKPKIYNYPDCLRGDTVNALPITTSQTVDNVTTPLDLTNIDIDCKFVYKGITKNLSVGSGITKTDAAAGEFQIDEIIFDVVGVYKYDLRFTYASGKIKTYLKGEIKILQDVTN
jgi:hypothetical protein